MAKPSIWKRVSEIGLFGGDRQGNPVFGLRSGRQTPRDLRGLGDDLKRDLGLLDGHRIAGGVNWSPRR